MAASTALTDIVFDTGTATASPLMACEQYCYVAAEFDGPNQSYIYNPYKIVEIVLQTSSTGAYLDVDGDPADSDAVLDWNINNATNAAPDTSTGYPFFYRIMNVSSTKIIRRHESQLKTLTGIKLVVASEVAAEWSNPVS